MAENENYLQRLCYQYNIKASINDVGDLQQSNNMQTERGPQDNPTRKKVSYLRIMDPFKRKMKPLQ